MSKKATKKGSTKRPRNKRVDVFVEEVVRHGNRTKAADAAGYKQPRMAGSRLMTNDDILDRVEKRKAEAMRRSQINTDIIVGSLAEIATASLADVLDENGEFDLNTARENGVDHLIKKLRTKVRYYSNGVGKDPGKEVTHEYEMYSRLDALNQLRDNFGMKEEPRPNTLDERKKREVEESISRIMERDGIDQQAAAKQLLAELGDEPEFTAIISEYTN